MIANATAGGFIRKMTYFYPKVDNFLPISKETQQPLKAGFRSIAHRMKSDQLTC